MERISESGKKISGNKIQKGNLLPLYIQKFIKDEIDSKNNRFYVKNNHKIKSNNEPDYFYKPFVKCEGYYSGNFNWQPVGVSIQD